MPANLLTTGRYVVIVRAISEPTGDFVNATNRRGSFPYAHAEVLSAEVIVP